MTDAGLDGLLARLDDKARHDGYQLAGAAAQSSYPEIVERCAKGTDWYVAAAAIRKLRADNEALRLAALAVREACKTQIDGHAFFGVTTPQSLVKEIESLQLDPITEGHKLRGQVRREAIEEIARSWYANTERRDRYSANLDGGIDQDDAGPWLINSDVDKAIRALADKKEPTT